MRAGGERKIGQPGAASLIGRAIAPSEASTRRRDSGKLRSASQWGLLMATRAQGIA
jgi:hypothetical protein